MYYKKKDQDPESKKDNFFTKEKQITFGRKKVVIGGAGHLTVKLTDALTSKEDTDTGHIPQGETYSERQFCELRESILEL